MVIGNRAEWNKMMAGKIPIDVEVKETVNKE